VVKSIILLTMEKNTVLNLFGQQYKVTRINQLG
jgi:hypothetical protein